MNYEEIKALDEELQEWYSFPTQGQGWAFTQNIVSDNHFTTDRNTWELLSHVDNLLHYVMRESNTPLDEECQECHSDQFRALLLELDARELSPVHLKAATVITERARVINQSDDGINSKEYDTLRDEFEALMP